jgi:hypothetical protein
MTFDVFVRLFLFVAYLFCLVSFSFCVLCCAVCVIAQLAVHLAVNK